MEVHHSIHILQHIMEDLIPDEYIWELKPKNYRKIYILKHAFNYSDFYVTWSYKNTIFTLSWVPTKIH